MKKSIIVIELLLFVIVFDNKIFNNTLYNMYDDYFISHNYKIVSNKNLLKDNKYHNDILSSYIKETDNYEASNKQELLDIYFTAINRGYDNLTFYCSDDYINCMKDIEELDNEENEFSYINQLVNTYNSYNSIESTYINGKIDIKINRKYSKEDIEKIDNKINDLINILEINNYSDEKTKIKVFHDYLANTNKYDEDKAQNKDSDYHSDIAIGTLFEGKSICSGYTDTMSIFLDKLNIKNTKIATNKHVWNAIYLDDKWYHLDLTWDDPVTTNNIDIILYNYFMITTDELMRINDNEHNFDETIYDFIN